MKIENFDKEKSVVITTIGQKLVRELQSTTQEETLEEAAKEFVLSHDFSKLTNPNHLANRCFQFGANWQAERMYSEEDMIEFAKWVFLEVGSNTGKDRTNKELFNEWLNIKKK